MTADRGHERQVSPSAAESSHGLNIEAVIDALPAPVYVLDSENTVTHWSHGLESLLGLTAEEMLGTDEYFGRNDEGERIKTLSNHVVENPHRADDAEHIERIESEYISGTSYESSTWLLNDDGEERFVRFTATPVFEGEELQAVVQICTDETEQRRKKQATEALVEEIIETIIALSEGKLDARAEFEQGQYVESHLLTVLEKFNEMAESLETMVSEIDDQTATVSESAAMTTDSAEQIDDLVGEQTEALGNALEELEDFSARMEEVAGNSNEVATAADQAQSAAERGLSAGEEARQISSRLVDTGDELVETVDDLKADMDRIGDVVEVIQDIAQQTNLLSLNASIEAANAGEDGRSFTVVADEVKQLATETERNADKITTQIERVQTQTEETVFEIEQTNEELTRGLTQVEQVLDALSSIEALVTDVSAGIGEIATANDGQAQAVEELLTMLEDVQTQAEAAREASQHIVDQGAQQRSAVDQLVQTVGELTDEEIRATE